MRANPCTGEVALIAVHLTSRHDDDNRCPASTYKSSTQRTSDVVASLGGAPNYEEIGLVGIGYPQQLFRGVSLGMDERDVDTMVLSVRSDLLAQFLCLIGHRLLNSPVRNDCAG